MKIAGTVLGLALACAAGFLVSWRLWPGRAKPAVLLVSLALPAGLSITGGAYFLWLVVSGGRASWYPPLEVGALAGAAFIAWRNREKRRERVVLPPRPKLGLDAAAAFVLAVAACTALTVTLRHADVTPWGYWDAWSRINLKARFLHEGGAHWTWIFRSPDVLHPDYPLLLECSVARLWHWSGGIHPLPAQTLSVLSWVACFAALVTLAGHLSSTGVAAAAGILFLCQRSDRSWAAMQYADFALATYFILGAGLLVLALRRRHRAERWFPLVGFCAGSAAWCKSEGLVFTLFLGVWVGTLLRAEPRRLKAAWMLGRGLLMGGASLLVLKLGFAGKSFMFGARTRPVWEDLIDLSRYRTVGGCLVRHLRAEMAGWSVLALVLALVLLPRRREVQRSLGPLVLCGAMALALLLVLVTIPYELEWAAGTTVDRFVLQLWPLAILGMVAGLRSTE